MKRRLLYAASAIALLASPLALQAQSTDSSLEFALMPSTKTVILLNEGGKYIAIDMKHIAQGETCRMNKDATIVRVGPGAAAGMVRVRYAAGQISSGGCPFMTMFDLPEPEYLEGRAAFLNMKEEALRKIDQIKKDLGEKWDELIGKKSSGPPPEDSCRARVEHQRSVPTSARAPHRTPHRLTTSSTRSSTPMSSRIGHALREDRRSS